MNGEYGSIIKKELHGIATPEDIKRKLEIIENRNPDDTTYKIKALIDSSPDGTLSQIYMNLGKEDLSAKYEDLELKFGLVDVDGNLLVDRDYYSGVITNYQKFSEQHIINSVAAYVRKHKISYSPFNNNGKSIDLSTDNKVPEVEKQAYMYKQLNYTSIDNDINNIWGKSKSNPFHSENQVSNF